MRRPRARFAVAAVALLTLFGGYGFHRIQKVEPHIVHSTIVSQP